MVRLSDDQLNGLGKEALIIIVASLQDQIESIQGQLDSANAMLSDNNRQIELLTEQIRIMGLVKDDHHRTRGLYFNNVELPIDTHSEGFKLITRVQDEAHRFAIEYHRSLRGKKSVSSVLDEIPGIGPARRRALMRAFDSLDEIRAATVEDLSMIAEIPADVAESVYAFFHKEN